MKCKIIVGPRNYDLKDILIIEDDDFIIGADQGAFILASNGYKFDLALGDYDSVNDDEMLLIKKYAAEVKTYPSRKDDTDSYLAVKEALYRGYQEIEIIGGIGGRLDHTLANINLLKLGNITMSTNNEVVYLLDPGKYDVENNFKYISFFALEDVSNLTLVGFKYELEDIQLDTNDPLCISNEGQGSISFSEGLILVIHQNE